MKTFEQFIETMGWNPASTANWANDLMANTDALESAIKKVMKASQRIPVSTIFTDSGVLAQQLGLNSQELQSLKDYRVLTKVPEGVEINKKAFDRYAKMF